MSPLVCGPCQPVLWRGCWWGELEGRIIKDPGVWSPLNGRILSLGGTVDCVDAWMMRGRGRGCGCGCGCSFCSAVTTASQVRRSEIQRLSPLLCPPRSSSSRNAGAGVVTSVQLLHPSVWRLQSCDTNIRTRQMHTGRAWDPSFHLVSSTVSRAIISPGRPSISSHPLVTGTHIAAVTPTPVQMDGCISQAWRNKASWRRRHPPSRTTHDVAARPLYRL